MGVRYPPELVAVLEGIGYRAHARRRALGLTQEEVADAMWQSQTVVSKIEQAKVDHRLRGLFRLAEVLRFDIADLFPPVSRAPISQSAILPPYRVPMVGSLTRAVPSSMFGSFADVLEPPKRSDDLSFEEFMVEFGGRIRDRRKALKLSQMQVGWAMGLISTESVGRLERGANVQVGMLVRAALALNVDLAPLMRRESVALTLTTDQASSRIGVVGRGRADGPAPQRLSPVGVFGPPPVPEPARRKAGRRRRACPR